MKKIMRSTAYPSITLMNSIKIAEKIYQHYGDISQIKGEDLGKIFNKLYTSMKTDISSCVQYGLLELKKGKGYRPTALFKQIYKPISDEEKGLALLASFKRPKIYNKLISLYNNSYLPTPSALSNDLHRNYGITEKASIKAASIFIDNVNDLNLKKDDNLKVESINLEEQQLDSFEVNPSENNINKPAVLDRSEQVSNIGFDDKLKRIDILLTNKKKGVLYIPSDINEDDLKLLQKQIEVIELYINITKERDKELRGLSGQ